MSSLISSGSSTRTAWPAGAGLTLVGGAAAVGGSGNFASHEVLACADDSSVGEAAASSSRATAGKNACRSSDTGAGGALVFASDVALVLESNEATCGRGVGVDGGVASLAAK